MSALSLRLKRLAWTILSRYWGQYVVMAVVIVPPVLFLRVMTAAPYLLYLGTGLALGLIMMFALPSQAAARAKLRALEPSEPQR